MEIKNGGIEHKLSNDINETQKEYDNLVEVINTNERRKEEIEETLNSLKKTLQFYLAKSGQGTRNTISVTSEFINIRKVSDAIHIILQKYGDMDKQQLRDALIRGGYNFGTKKPIPVIHFALVADKKITITEQGTYKWIGYSKSKVEILSLPKGIIKFFRERGNEPATTEEVLEGIIKMGVRTTTKDLKGNLEQELMYSNRFDRTEDDKFKLKQDIFSTV